MTTTSTSPRSSSSPGPGALDAARLLGVPVQVTGTADGDLVGRLADGDPALADVAWVEQVHGTAVLAVDRPGRAGVADALVTATPGVRLLVRAADCAPLALAAPGVVGAAHGGWKGLAGGVVVAAAEALRALSGEADVRAWLGPCIRPCCYEFGADDLELVVAALGPAVRGTTSWGTPALDVPAAVAAACERAGVELLGQDGRCTACALDGAGRPALWSHRARADRARHGVLVALPAGPDLGLEGSGS